MINAIKTRILLFIYFSAHAVLSLLWTWPGLEIIAAEKEAAARRRAAGAKP